MECMQVYLCGIQYYTLYFYTFKHLLLNPFFFPVSCLKIFSTIYSPQHCFSHLSPARFNFLNFSISQFTVFLFFFFVLVPEISLLLSFLCSLLFSFYSCIRTRIQGFVWLSLFLRLFTYCFIFLYFIVISCPTSLIRQFKLLPLR